MSWPDRGSPGLPRAFAALILVAAVGGIGLAGCTVQPLYAPAPSGHLAPATAALAAIAIDPVDTRVAQVVRNRLIFDFTGGAGEPASPTYRLQFAVKETEIPLGATREDVPPSYSVALAATYQVTEMATGTIVFSGTSRAQGAYDPVNQGFANVRAKRDAENRAATALADDMRTRLAAAFASGIAPAAPAPPPGPAGAN